MKLTPKLEAALNDQLNLELLSAYAYLGMAAYFEHAGFSGFAQWMRLQGDEEQGHARKFFDYLVDRGGRVRLKPIAEPRAEFPKPLEAFRASLAHEQVVSASICGLYELATTDKDFATLSFLKWFLDEQVEEEKTVSDMIARLELIGENHNGLYHLDRLAAKRAAKEDAEA